MKRHLLECGILDWTNELMYRIAPEAVDPAILSRGALSYHRYTRSALLLLRDDALSRDRPNCTTDERVKNLAVWKLDQPNYLNRQNSNCGNDNNEYSDGGSTTGRKIGNNRLSVGVNNSAIEGNNSNTSNGISSSSSLSNSQLLQQQQQKSSIEPNESSTKDQPQLPISEKPKIDISNDVESVTNCNNLQSPPPARSTPAKKLIANIIDDDDNKKDIENNNIDGDKEKSTTLNDDKLQQNAFNIDAFLNVDPLNNCFGGEQKSDDNIVSGSSRFRHWFKSSEQGENGLKQQQPINNTKRASLNEELINIIKDDSTQLVDKNLKNDKFMSLSSPNTMGTNTGGTVQQQQHHNNSLLEFLQRGNFNSGQELKLDNGNINFHSIGGYQQHQQQQIHNDGGIIGRIGGMTPTQINNDVNNFNKLIGGCNQNYNQIDHKQKRLIPSVEELEARMRFNDDFGILLNQNIINQKKFNSTLKQFNETFTNHQINNTSIQQTPMDYSVLQNNKLKQDGGDTFKRLLEQITPNIKNNNVRSATASTTNDFIERHQSNSTEQTAQTLLEQLTQQIIREKEFLQKMSQASNLTNGNLNELLNRPEAQILLRGVARGELTQSSLLQLANTAGGGPYRDVILPILALLRIPSPLQILHNQQQHQQQRNLSTIPGSILNSGGIGQQQQHQPTKGLPQRIPSPLELQAHTQSIMQTAFMRRKLEEQQANYRRRQELLLRQQQKQQEYHNNLLKQNSIEIDIGDFVGGSNNLRNSPTSSESQQIHSPTPILAFTPTSVLRKMTSEKDNNNVSPNSDSTNSGSNNNKSHNYQQQHNNTPSRLNQQTSSSMSGKPRMILGGGNRQQQNTPDPVSPQSLCLAIQQQIKWNSTNNQIGWNKTTGGPTAGTVSSGVQPTQMSLASKIEFQQLQEQKNKMQHLPTAQQSSGNNISVNHKQQQFNLQQIFQQQQQRHRAIRAQQQQRFLSRISGSNNSDLTISISGNNDNSNNANSQILSQSNLEQHQQQLNTQREGELSPTSNQLAKWFTPELLAQASAGKLPALNTNQALSLEEFEKNVQNSSTDIIHSKINELNVLEDK